MHAISMPHLFPHHHKHSGHMKSSLMAPKLKTTAAERKRKSRENKRNEDTLYTVRVSSRTWGGSRSNISDDSDHSL